MKSQPLSSWTWVKKLNHATAETSVDLHFQTFKTHVGFNETLVCLEIIIPYTIHLYVIF